MLKTRNNQCSFFFTKYEFVFSNEIFQNMIRGMRVLVDANRKLNIPLHNAHNRLAGDQLLLFDNFQAVDVHNFSDFGPILAGLWADPGIRAAFERRSEYQLTDSVAYFYTNLERVASPNYVPTQQVFQKSTWGWVEVRV
jgi:guanine nucleotide-binding protein subunit alpha-12